jgi:DNA-binding transcriptional MerR regulator
MLIGEIVNKTGLSKDTIRFYEKHKLISLSRKERRENNYKEYSEEVLNRLLTIKRLKGFGFTLNEIVELLDMIEYDIASCDNVKEKIEDKVALIDVKIKELTEIRTLLKKSMALCATGCSPKFGIENCGVLLEG